MDVCVSVFFLGVYVCCVNFWRKEGCVLYECCERWYVALFYDVMGIWCEFRGFWLSGLVLCVESVCQFSQNVSKGFILFDPRNFFFAWVIGTW